MPRTKEYPNLYSQSKEKHLERGASIIVVVIVMSFIITIGVLLLTITGTGTKVAGNIRTQQEAFNAAEAGFDAGWTAIDEYFADGTWSSFEGHFLKEPHGIDLPDSKKNYFRRLTDVEILDLIDPNEDGNPDLNNILFYLQPYVTNSEGQLDLKYTYTVFLIDDKANGGEEDPSNALMICIGSVRTGNKMTTSRLEISLAAKFEGSNP